MDLVSAVNSAKNGDNAGFTYLYEQTYQKSYYIAFKYLKNEQAAMDVLQESYIKAFQSMDQLEDATKFEPWLGRIVATRSLNELKKNNPLLFSEAENEDEGDISDTFEDDRIDTRPDLAIDQQETSRLIREMMADLSDEQRMCVTMFYMEEMSVKEIAETLGVSENTVKSRLNYGRTKIKDKVLALEKQGTKLYGMLPMVFFFALFKKDAMACEAVAPTVEAVLSTVNAGSKVGKIAATGAKTTATVGTKTGLTIGGVTVTTKVFVATVAAVLVIGGGVAYVVSHNDADTATEETADIDSANQDEADELNYEEINSSENSQGTSQSDNSDKEDNAGKIGDDTAGEIGEDSQAVEEGAEEANQTETSGEAGAIGQQVDETSTESEGFSGTYYSLEDYDPCEINFDSSTSGVVYMGDVACDFTKNGSSYALSNYRFSDGTTMDETGTMTIKENPDGTLDVTIDGSYYRLTNN